jgi:hypothetical protein
MPYDVNGKVTHSGPEDCQNERKQVTSVVLQLRLYSFWSLSSCKENTFFWLHNCYVIANKLQSLHSEPPSGGYIIDLSRAPHSSPNQLIRLLRLLHPNHHHHHHHLILPWYVLNNRNTSHLLTICYRVPSFLLSVPASPPLFLLLQT